MPLLDEAELSAFPELPASAVVRDYVARYWDMMALAEKAPLVALGAGGLLRDKPGFEIEFLSGTSEPGASTTPARQEVLMAMRGHWRLGWDGGEAVLAPGDTCLVPAGLVHRLSPAMSGEASLFRVRATDDPAGPTWRPQ